MDPDTSEFMAIIQEQKKNRKALREDGFTNQVARSMRKPRLLNLINASAPIFSRVLEKIIFSKFRK